MAQTAAHLVDHVIPPVLVRQWVISVPKRLRGFLADRPAAVAALTRIFIEEIERLLGSAAGVTSDASGPAAARPRLGAVSFLHRFGSALNQYVHLHVCATEGVFGPAADGAGCDASPAFLPARPINQADLAALTERVRRRLIRWFRLTRLLDTAAAADMLTWENSGFSVDASVRITLIDRDVPSYFRSLEHLLRSSARGQSPSLALGHPKSCAFHGSCTPGTSSLRCSRLFVHSLLETREKRHRSGCGAFRETRSGRPGRSSRGSRVAHQPEDRCGGAIDRAILGPPLSGPRRDRRSGAPRNVHRACVSPHEHRDGRAGSRHDQDAEQWWPRRVRLPRIWRFDVVQ